jgi:hypothetical protein
MLRTIVFPLSLLVASAAQAVCIPDAPEFGDTGPGSERVCGALTSQFPRSDIRIVDRKIHSGNSVSVVASVDGRVVALAYDLVGSDWVLAEPTVAASD